MPTTATSNGTNPGIIHHHSSSNPLDAYATSMEFPDLIGLDVPRQLERLAELLQKESKIRDGAEALLQAAAADKESIRKQIGVQLESAKSKIASYQRKLEQLKEQTSRAQASSSSRATGGRANVQGKKKTATNGLTFLNGTGLPTQSSNLNYANQISASAATTDTALESFTLTNTNPIRAPHSSTSNDPSAAKRFFAPSLVPQPASRARAKTRDGDESDYKTALMQAKGISKRLAAFAPPAKIINVNTGSKGQGSPPTTSPSAGFALTSSATSAASTTSLPSPKLLNDDDEPVDLERARLELMTGLTQIIARNQRILWEVDIKEVLSGLIPALSDPSALSIRVAAYRLLRYLIAHPEGPDLFHNFDGKDLSWFLVRSLARDNKQTEEKEQVFLLVRALVDIGSERKSSNTLNSAHPTTDPASRHGRGPSLSNGPIPPPQNSTRTFPLKENVIRALVSVAEHEEDANVLRLPAIEIIAEIFLLDPFLIHRSEGTRVLLHTLANGPSELGPILTSIFLTILDNPHTRRCIVPITDIEMGIYGITDIYGRGDARTDAMKASAKVVVTLMRSWTGLMHLCMNDMLTIRSLVDTLRIPNLDNREIVLDMLFEILNIKPAEWYQTFLDGRRLTMYGRQKHSIEETPEPVEMATNTDKPTLVDQYLTLVLAVLTEAGLLDALICMVEELSGNVTNLSRKATLLLGEVLQTANKLLPLSYAAKIQALPKLFNLASDYNRGQNRMIGTTTLSSIDSFNRNRSRLQPAPVRDSRNRANSTDDPMRRGQRTIEQVKIKMALQIDDKTFQTMLIDTQVVQTKDHAKWDYNILVELFEGPLLNGKRTEEAFKLNKWGRKLIAFWNPTSRKFSDLPKRKGNARWIKLGCLILTTLVKTTEGTRFLLSEDDLLKDLAECFAQLDPWNGTPAYDSIFSKQKLEDTLSCGYLQMLGHLSRTTRGIELMEHFKFFTAFYHLSDLKFREDLIKGIIENLDYAVDGHSRIVLSKALTSSYRELRIHSTEHLRKLILNSKQANVWTLRLLLTQLYDPAPEVRELAVTFLEEACENREILQMVVEMQPTLDHLGELGHPLLLRFMSTDSGFLYLHQTEYIEREMNAWFHERNLQYVVLVEVYLAQAFSTDPAEDGEDLLFDGIAPPHFYGEMVKTELGCQVLREKGHFSDFTHFIRQHGVDYDDPDIILKLKSVLWAVGNIGASERGIPFLEDDEIIPMILDIAELSPVLSVRGTCFFVLGLISSTEQGAEILSDYGWLATMSSLGNPTGMCIPEDIGKFMAVPTWETPNLADTDRRLPPLKSHHERECLEAIENLCNTVVANAASRTLAKLKSRNDTRHIFSSVPLYHRVLHTISTRRYRLPVRRYILELFDLKLDGTVLEELAQCSHQAQEELINGGGYVFSPRHSHGHHPHGSRRSRYSIRAKSRRKSNTEFRNNAGHDEEGNNWTGADGQDSPAILRPKHQTPRVVGFEVPKEESLANAMIMQMD